MRKRTIIARDHLPTPAGQNDLIIIKMIMSREKHLRCLWISCVGGEGGNNFLYKLFGQLSTLMKTGVLISFVVFTKEQKPLVIPQLLF